MEERTHQHYSRERPQERNWVKRRVRSNRGGEGTKIDYSMFRIIDITSKSRSSTNILWMIHTCSTKPYFIRTKIRTKNFVRKVTSVLVYKSFIYTFITLLTLLPFCLILLGPSLIEFLFLPQRSHLSFLSPHDVLSVRIRSVSPNIWYTLLNEQ